MTEWQEQGSGVESLDNLILDLQSWTMADGNILQLAIPYILNETHMYKNTYSLFSGSY